MRQKGNGSTEHQHLHAETGSNSPGGNPRPIFHHSKEGILMLHIHRLAGALLLAQGLLITSTVAQTSGSAIPPFRGKAIRAAAAPTSPPTPQQLQQTAQNFADWIATNAILQKHPQFWPNKSITRSQIRNAGDLFASSPDAQIRWHERNGTPIFIAGRHLQDPQTAVALQSPAARNSATARAFLNRYAPLLKIDDPGNEFRETENVTDETERSQVRFQQYARGLELWGKQVVVELDPSGSVELFTGRYEPTPGVLPAAGIMVSEAVARALNDLTPRAPLREMSPRETSLLDYSGPSSRKLIFCDDATGAPRPAYLVEIRPDFLQWWRYFIDAENGAILAKYNATCTDGPATATAIDLNNQTRTINTYQYQGTYFLIDASRPMFNPGASQFPDNTVGTIWTITAKNTDLTSLAHVVSTDNTWSDPSAVSAHSNGALTYEYYRQTHNRSAIDGNGGTIVSVIHVTSQGQSMDNAFWNGKVMAYGDGRNEFKPLAGGLDVAAHEMTHGVTERTAGLEYANQSGALNESFSDMFAIMVDRSNFKIGEDVVLPAVYPSGCLRDMQDPHNGGTGPTSPSWQPAHMNEFQQLDISDDNGGVHVNSGIPNKACYLLCTAITREKAEKILYRTLTTKLTKQSKFIDFRLAAVQSAQELYGNGAEVQAVKSACDQVGITDGSGSGGPGDWNPVNGADKMLATSTDPADVATLWIVLPPAQNANDFIAMSQTPVLRKPVVSDDGALAIFIDTLKALRIMALNPLAPNEQVLDNTLPWNNCALSRDRKLLAANTSALAATIILFDVSATPARSKVIKLETPAYSNTPVPNSIQYADAMDFTFDKSALLFDCYNELPLGTGGVISFWEINLLRVWDTAKNDFGSGDAMRIFPYEPGISIGNPAMSKTKPTVFAFDRQDPATQTGEIWAVDSYTGTAKKVADATYPEPGFPGYSGDDKILSFDAVNAAQEIDIMNVGMGSDGITAAGTPAQYVRRAVYPVWFREGTRPAGVTDRTLAAAAGFSLAQNYPNPFGSDGKGSPGSTTISFTLPARSDVTLAVYDMLGRETLRLARSGMESGFHSLSWDGRDAAGRLLPAGMYICRLSAGSLAASRTMTILR